MNAGWLWLVLRLVHVILGGCSRFRDLGGFWVFWFGFSCFDGLVVVAFRWFGFVFLV